ncbi:Universal stress protein family [Serinicoccus hydrothermalis]|uniref:Universal stress protein family n=1 Tax=Serinicoccus hydrothermalis TaxID=1758689 RepID=A0A1B1NCU0_9MICO|nr:universal stress protein [Serinicoccus hydrothermalis]ANS79259.1 Universal stress protein family [Serinicoccus hydrothermalis]
MVEQVQSTGRPLVVGFDGSDSAEQAVRWAAQAAARAGQPLVVLHAADRIVYAQDEVAGIWDPAQMQEVSLRAAEAGARIAREQEPGLTATAQSSLLSPRQALDEASAQAAGVVVGTRGLGRVRKALVGTTAYGVSGHSRCPVTVVPHDAPVPGPGAPVVVGIDGSVSGERALAVAAREAEMWGAELHIVCSWERPHEDPWGLPPVGFSTVQEAADAAQEGAEEILREAAERLQREHEGLVVSTKAPSGRTEESLLEATEGAGLLVLGNRGHGRLSVMLLGSTTSHMLHLSRIAVQVVP